jgi:hypothetical protein
MDGLCPPELCKITDYDRRYNVVGLEFVDKCVADDFCSKRMVDPLLEM